MVVRIENSKNCATLIFRFYMIVNLRFDYEGYMEKDFHVLSKNE